MELIVFGPAIIGIAILVGYLIFAARKPNVDHQAQIAHDEYLQKPMSNLEIGRNYERYIGYLYESKYYSVDYNGVENGVRDMGRDLIVSKGQEVQIIQTKCWAKFKMIHESHIFQLFGSMTHYKMTLGSNHKVSAVFFTSAQFSAVACEVANVLGVELRTQSLNTTYPMIKCSVNSSGNRFYYLPLDQQYDAVKMKPQRGDFFAHTVREATDKGFSRALQVSRAA